MGLQETPAQECSNLMETNFYVLCNPSIKNHGELHVADLKAPVHGE